MGIDISHKHNLVLMCATSLLRLRQELAKLIVTHTDKISEAVAKATAQSTLYDSILQGLSVSVLFHFRNPPCLQVNRKGQVRQVIQRPKVRLHSGESGRRRQADALSRHVDSDNLMVYT